MELVLLSLAVFLGGGCLSLALGKSPAANVVGCASALVGSAIGVVPACSQLFRPLGFSPLVLEFLPLGPTVLTLDSLAAVFTLPVLILSALCAVYGFRQVAPLARTRHLGVHWFFYNILAGGMFLVFCASDAFSFMLAWEAMSLAPFFLLCLHDDDASVRSAALTYLIAAHLGALALLACFGLLSMQTGGSLAFADFKAVSDAAASGIFLLALVGFGAKIGLMPVHVWLPEAYPAAPNHVAGLMSGAMVNTGVYGILRVLSFCGAGEEWWAFALIGVGAVTGFTGICFAMAQKNIKRALAYSSVENMGIVCLGIGMGLLCRGYGYHELALLCLTGTLLHMVNHALSKSLLFLGAGAVRTSAGSRNLNLLGGLIHRMPVVAACFAVGSASIAALPPFNGFAGEFLLYLAMASGGSIPAGNASLVFWLGLFVLAGIGGFTLLCFSRMFALTFLGEARSERAGQAQDPDRVQKGCLVALACLCVASAMLAPTLADLIRPAALTPLTMPQAVAVLTQTPDMPVTPAMPPAALSLESAGLILTRVNNAFILVLALFGALYLVRKRLLRGRSPARGATWGCGYIAPTARMQYTGASFSQPATTIMRSLLHQEEHSPGISRYFPETTHASITTADRVRDGIFIPLFTALTAFARRCKKLQHGHLNAYVLYILLTLIALLAWELR